ncbi:hypothetical protein GN157_12815 [Flavobacterium rakeshii]|uniref:Uncharacterized protein n=1 Tax=Flavobacterium rakeshii TaxID=1038845 RepID=A0A6N8HFY6_9FLAO|nr:hypothetical protein [Flavobacterium rakeshii]MUV04591.1 hypothetical protein [Flavobacterium rakeshii]
MLTHITWTDYFRFSVLATLVYYLLLLLKFYLPTLQGRRAVSGNALIADADHQDSALNHDIMDNLTPAGGIEGPVTDYETVEEMIERVKSTFGRVVGSDKDQETVTQTLTTILRDYPSLKESGFRPAINEFIVTEARQQGIEFLHEENVNGLWP